VSGNGTEQSASRALPDEREPERATAAAASPRSRAVEPELRVDRLSVHYDGVQALDEVSLEVRKGELVTVIGANGAGKSSLLNAVIGVVPKRSGRAFYRGDDITAASPEVLVARGVTLVPERRELFAALSVRDNLLLGAFHRIRRRDREVRTDLERVLSIFPRLAERVGQVAGTMSGGEQQMLALGRAMMSRPSLLLLDEPSLGLAPLIAEEIFRVIQKLRDDGCTILLIEQNARAALRLADYGYLLETGRLVTGGPADELARDPRVAEAYLGLGAG
jgi:branched-chain amino acid transport system ATP-binding protein